MHYLSLDLETTGLNPGEAGINEIAFIHYNGEEKVSEFSVFPKVDQTAKFSLGALKVNDYRFQMGYRGTCEEHVRDAILSYFKVDLYPKIGSKKVKIVGHNVAFDVVHLKAFLAKLNITGWEEIFDYSVVDTSTIGQALRDTGIITMEKMSLGALAETLGLEIDPSKLHTAMYDAELSMRCYIKMKSMLRNLARKD